MKSSMFDPFGDLAEQGYLRNRRGDIDPRVIKAAEHNFFEANIADALAYLAACPELTYTDFLKVHQILFSDYYPWAGQDRSITMPNSAVRKGEVWFSHPNDARLAVEHGLRIGAVPETMTRRFGEVMGLFAFGHPFLDGNGRTMLLVHMELCHRAGFSINWHRVKKDDYLRALTAEIAKPGQGVLEEYLAAFKTLQVPRERWGGCVLEIKGLDGLDDGNVIESDINDPAIAEKYQQIAASRGYSYTALSPQESKAGLNRSSSGIRRK